jgi:hypothetical protein
MMFLTSDMLVKLRSLVYILKVELEFSSYLSLIANITQKWYGQKWVKVELGVVFYLTAVREKSYFAGK